MNFSHVRHDTPQQRPVRADCIHIAYTQTCRRTHMHMGDAAPPRVRHDSSVRVPCRIHTARMHTHRTNVRLIWRTRSMPLSLTTGSAISWRAPTLTCLLPKNNPRASAHHVIPLVLYLLHVRAPPFPILLLFLLLLCLIHFVTTTYFDLHPTFSHAAQRPQCVLCC